MPQKMTVEIARAFSEMKSKQWTVAITKSYIYVQKQHTAITHTHTHAHVSSKQCKVYTLAAKQVLCGKKCLSVLLANSGN